MSKLLIFCLCAFLASVQCNTIPESTPGPSPTENVNPQTENPINESAAKNIVIEVPSSTTEKPFVTVIISGKPEEESFLSKLARRTLIGKKPRNDIKPRRRLTALPTEVQNSTEKNEESTTTSPTKRPPIDPDNPPEYLLEGAKGNGEWLSGVYESSNIMNKEHPEWQPKVGLIDTKKQQLIGDYMKGLLAKDEDTVLKFPELVKKYGYPIQTHLVTTADGYVLTLYRIPHGAGNPPAPGFKRPVAFLMHGLTDSSDNWIITGPEKGLGYVLADAGYDVWLGNARGNVHSRRHVELDPDYELFWDFSWHDIGVYDLPAMIDHALAVAGESRLHYVGHSQGTTSFFVMCSTRPEYNAKVRLMVALAPIAWMSNMRSPMIRLMSPLSRGIEWVTTVLGKKEFLPNRALMTVGGGLLCREKAFTADLCANSLFLVTGYNAEQVNATMMPVLLGHVPAGSSVRQFMHYAQGEVSGRFRMYDFGSARNKRTYGYADPPDYDVYRVRCPVSLFYSQNDWLSHPKDVDTLAKSLGNIVHAYEVPNKKFNHMDYMWAVDVKTLVYDELLALMEQYL